MKSVYIKDMQKEAEVNDYFIVVKKGVYTSKNNTKYVSVRLKDRTGVIEGRIWDRADELAAAFERNDIVYVESRAKLYQEQLQLNVSSIRKVEKELSAEELKEFYPESRSGDEKLRQDFFGFIAEIKNPHLKLLFEALARRKEMLERFMFFPASVGIHHVYVGGLLEHSLTVAEMGKGVAPLAGADADIVTAGALFHDIGKVDEITVKGAFGYSDRGRLLGHITLGVMIFDELVKEVDGFPAYLADVMRHIIISHHGEMEWGSPKKPMCIEALVVHYLDNLDAKVVGVKEHMKEGMEDEKWTQYHKLYESRFYKIPER